MSTEVGRLRRFRGKDQQASANKLPLQVSIKTRGTELEEHQPARSLKLYSRASNGFRMEPYRDRVRIFLEFLDGYISDPLARPSYRRLRISAELV